MIAESCVHDTIWSKAGSSNAQSSLFCEVKSGNTAEKLWVGVLPGLGLALLAGRPGWHW